MKTAHGLHLSSGTMDVYTTFTLLCSHLPGFLLPACEMILKVSSASNCFCRPALTCLSGWNMIVAFL